MVYSIKPLILILTPIIAGMLILLSGDRHKNIREFWTILASIINFLIILSMIPIALKGTSIEFTIITIFQHVPLQLRVDALGMIFASLASILWIVVSVYSIGYMRGLNEHAQTRYFFFFTLAICGAIGVAFSANLITLYMFYEILSLSTYPLVCHKESAEAIKIGRKYLIYMLISAAFILFSIGLTYKLTGSLDFVAGGFIEGSGSQNLLRILFFTFIIGFGAKAGIMPIHEWLPSAMVAPTPVSALLHAVAVVKAGVFCCIRVMHYIFGPKLLLDLNLWLIFAYIVSFTIIAANMIAIAQDNLKRRLAFSTINSLSVILLGSALLTPDAIRGSILFLAFHGFMKITLFLCAGAIYVKTHKQNISDLDGIGKQMPITMAAFTIGALGLIGIPPVCGFLSKWYLCLGAVDSKQLIFLFIFLTSALLDAIYFLPIIYNAFFKKSDGEKLRFNEAPALVVVPLGFTAIMSVILCIFPNFLLKFLNIANIAVQNILRGN